MTLVITLMGCTGFWELLREIRARHRRTLRRDELAEAMEDALASSSTIIGIRESIERNTAKLTRIDDWREQHEDETRRHRMIGLREAMMHDPHDRLSHEHMLLAGREYIESGGNGVGKTRYEELKQDFDRRVKEHDWTYATTTKGV